MNHKLQGLFENSGQAVSYMTGEITKICRDMEKRSPGSEGEREAAGYMADVLSGSCGCADVSVETFKEHPASFYGYCRISAVLAVLCCAGFFLHPSVTIVSGAATLILFLVHFVLYIPVLDRFFPEKESVNVTAVRPAAGETKRRIFLNGHIDAAWEFTLNYHFGGVVFEIPNILTLSGVIFYTAVGICAAAGAGAWTRTAALWGLIFLPFFAAVWFTYNPKQIVDGANDNLTGCYMGIAVLKEMEERGLFLENTEVGVILTGSEEAGLRGAKAWSTAHEEDFRDVPTFILSFDTIHDPCMLGVNEKDLNGTVKADKVLAEAFLKAAAMAQVFCRRTQVPLFGGSTDSAAFIKGGFRSVCITGLNHKLEDYYHTRKDSFDNLNTEGIENCYKAAVRLLELADEGELDN